MKNIQNTVLNIQIIYSQFGDVLKDEIKRRGLNLSWNWRHVFVSLWNISVGDLIDFVQLEVYRKWHIDVLGYCL